MALGMASSCRPVLVIRLSHSSSTGAGRAFSAGNAPTMPALHWAMTRSGPETMNSGEADDRQSQPFAQDVQERPSYELPLSPHRS